MSISPLELEKLYSPSIADASRHLSIVRSTRFFDECRFAALRFRPAVRDLTPIAPRIPENSAEPTHRLRRSGVTRPNHFTKRRNQMAEHSEQISTLNTLIATTIDSINGYEDSAENIDSERLRETFRQCANDRQQAVQSLREEVRRLGGNPEDDGSFLGKAHQRFADLKAAVTGRDEKAIINEVERGEDYIKGKFETALNGDELTGETRSVVEHCYQSIKSGHDRMSQLKHGMEAPTNS
jgi:uncharacterized protein (TIGR02284 family)